jgi:Zn-dependent protease
MLTSLSGIDLVIVLASLILSMSIHEAMHGYVAHWLGDSTAYDMGRLTLNPLKHINILTTVLLPMILILSHLPPIFAAQPVPINPYRIKYEEYGTALVGLAGPLTNFFLALTAGLIFRSVQPDPNSTLGMGLILFAFVNVALFVFNMIPFPPLDGSRLLYAFAPEGLKELMRQIEGAGFLVILFVLIVAFQFIAGPLARIESGVLTFVLGYNPQLL